MNHFLSCKDVPEGTSGLKIGHSCSSVGTTFPKGMSDGCEG